MRVNCQDYTMVADERGRPTPTRPRREGELLENTERNPNHENRGGRA